MEEGLVSPYRCKIINRSDEEEFFNTLLDIRGTMGRDRGARSGTRSGPDEKARSGQYTGDTHLSLLNAQTAGQTGFNRITQPQFSTSTWRAFAGQVIQATDSTSFGRVFGVQAIDSSRFSPISVSADTTGNFIYVTRGVDNNPVRFRIERFCRCGMPSRSAVC